MAFPNRLPSDERYGSYAQAVISMRANLSQVVAQKQEKSFLVLGGQE